MKARTQAHAPSGEGRRFKPQTLQHLVDTLSESLQTGIR